MTSLVKTIRVPEKPWRDLTDEELGGRRPDTCLVIRYGAVGDCIMASSLFPALREQGWKVAVNASETGENTWKADPHIDLLLVQKTNQIPNPDLSDWWARLSTLYGKTVNLSESIEGRFLLIPGREGYDADKATRHARCNRNYVEYAHEIAGVPFKNRQRFYPTDGERAWARRERASMGAGNFVILWSLSGSSIHKTWPRSDEAFARILTAAPHVRIVTVGDALCKLIEAPWRNEARVIRRSAKWKYRESLAFAQQADLVIGTETGVLNAVAMETVPKIIMLSHSSVENLTRDWMNCVSVEPPTACYPCHQMHYGSRFCRIEPYTHLAQCAWDIEPETVVRHILNHYEGKHVKAA